MDNQDSTESAALNPDNSQATKLKGCYLLVILSEPKTKEDKEEIIQRVAKGEWFETPRFFWPTSNCRSAVGNYGCQADTVNRYSGSNATLAIGGLDWRHS